MEIISNKTNPIPAPFTQAMLDRAKTNWQNRNVEIYVGGGMTLPGLGLIPVIGPFAAIICGIGMGILLHGLFSDPEKSDPLPENTSPLVRVQATPEQLAEKTYQAYAKALFNKKTASPADMAARDVFHSVVKEDSKTAARKLAQFRAKHPAEFPRVLRAAKELSSLIRRNQDAIAEFEPKPTQDKSVSNGKKAVAIGIGAIALGLSSLGEATRPSKPPPPKPPKKNRKPIKNPFGMPHSDTCPASDAPIDPKIVFGPHFPKTDPPSFPNIPPHTKTPPPFNDPKTFPVPTMPEGTGAVSTIDQIPTSIAVPMDATASPIDFLAKNHLSETPVLISTQTIRLILPHLKGAQTLNTPFGAIIQMLSRNEQLLPQDNIGFAVAISKEEAQLLPPLIRNAIQAQNASLAAAEPNIDQIIDVSKQFQSQRDLAMKNWEACLDNQGNIQQIQTL